MSCPLMFVRTLFRGPKIGSLCRVLLRLELYFEIAKFMNIYMQLISAKSSDGPRSITRKLFLFSRM